MILFSVFVSLSLVCVIHCGGTKNSSANNTDNNDDNNITDDTITITGSFSEGSVSQNVIKNFFAKLFLPEAKAFTDSEVATVIFFDSNGNYETATVTDGSFSIDVPIGTAVGLIFSDANKHFLGYITLDNGIDSLPLGKLDDGVTTIDLATLTATGDIIEPEHNPIGDELPLSSAEQQAIASSNSFFAAIVKNPDADGDGEIDILNNMFYRPFILYFVAGGNFESGLTPALAATADIKGYRFGLGVNDYSASPDFPSTVTFTGPEESGLDSVTNDATPNEENNSISFGSPYVTSPLIPPAGTYQIAYNDKTLTYDIPDQSSATQYIALSVPTITLNDDDTINKIEWEYKLGGGSGNETIDPESLISQIELQIDGNGTACDDYPDSQGTRIYNSEMQTSATVSHTLTCQDLLWSNVTNIYMAYNDIFGNHIVVTWDK